jgi:glycosyltransferase involved in cell wall biosynthesis
MKKITIVSPTYNEEDNILLLYKSIKNEIHKYENKYSFEFIIIDNASIDSTQDILRNIAKNDNNFKVILNTRNFGHIRSPYYGILQSDGDATIYIASDLQDPPMLIHSFIREWEMGWKVILASKNKSRTNNVMHKIRSLYYDFLSIISNVEIIKNATGFGLYDKCVIDLLRKINDPYPFFRGLIAELGFPVKVIDFIQPARSFGTTKNNIFTLYDNLILGVISHSNLPLRFSSFLGYIISIISFILSLVYLYLKYYNVYAFPKGVAPLIIVLLLLFGILFIMLGLLGEYISIIFMHIKNRPIVVELEKINFNDK